MIEVKKENLSLFPTPVTRLRGVITDEEIKKIFHFCKETDTGNHSAFVGAGTSTHETIYQLLDKLEDVVPGLKSRLEKVLNDHGNEIGFKPLAITNSWFNIQQKDSILKQHIHGNSVLSGALYINTGEDSKLYFENPNKFIKYFYYFTNRFTDYNFEYYYLEVKPGDMVIFPSWLSHGSNYEKNNTDDRIVISFNSLLG